LKNYKKIQLAINSSKLLPNAEVLLSLGFACYYTKANYGVGY